MLPSMEWAFSFSRTIQIHAPTPIHSPSLTENIPSLYYLYSLTSQAINGIFSDSSLPRFSCPCVVAISLISPNHTKARRAAKKLDAAPHCDAKQKMARARCICICRDSKKNRDKAEPTVRRAERWEAVSPCSGTDFSSSLPFWACSSSGKWRLHCWVVVTLVKYCLVLWPRKVILKHRSTS